MPRRRSYEFGELMVLVLVAAVALIIGAVTGYTTGGAAFLAQQQSPAMCNAAPPCREDSVVILI